MHGALGCLLPIIHMFVRHTSCDHLITVIPGASSALVGKLIFVGILPLLNFLYVDACNQDQTASDGGIHAVASQVHGSTAWQVI